MQDCIIRDNIKNKHYGKGGLNRSDDHAKIYFHMNLTNFPLPTPVLTHSLGKHTYGGTCIIVAYYRTTASLCYFVDKAIFI